MGFAASDHVLEGEMRIGGQEHFYLETQGTLAIPKVRGRYAPSHAACLVWFGVAGSRFFTGCPAAQGEDGEMELFASTQNPTKTQVYVAGVIGVPANRVVCRVKRMGGGFGGKETRCELSTTVCERGHCHFCVIVSATVRVCVCVCVDPCRNAQLIVPCWSVVLCSSPPQWLLRRRS